MTIANGRMCNVRRFLDRESAWCIAHIIQPLRHKPAELLFNVLLFRCYFNWSKSAGFCGLQSTTSFDRAAFAVRRQPRSSSSKAAEGHPRQTQRK